MPKFNNIQKGLDIFTDRTSPLREYCVRFDTHFEHWLDQERDQLPLLVPAGVGIGIVIWQYLGSHALVPVLCFCAAFAMLGWGLGRNRRLSGVMIAAGLTIAVGFLSIDLKSARVEAPALEKIWIGHFYGRISKVEYLTARNSVRFELKTNSLVGLPPKVRVNLDINQTQPAFKPGAIIFLHARLMPPTDPALPGGYDFARRAWFDEIGATGSALGKVQLYRASRGGEWLSELRRKLNTHVIGKMSMESGPIGAALFTGTQGAITQSDANAMRNSGMAHLLSISGLHVTAVVGAVFVMLSRLLALFPWLALRIKVPLYAAGGAAIAAIGYTMLTGHEVPTIRSCVAALLILAALMWGREALSLRLLGFGAVFVLLFWPEALAGPSFQLSFAAVTTIIVLHKSAWMQALAATPDSPWLVKMSRGLISLLLTGLAIELVLSPIAIFHFHKAGLYGALANMVAIPLTTFIIMPFEAVALFFDVFGLGAPFWWVASTGISVILKIAYGVSSLPGAVSMLPSMPVLAFGAMVLGGLWFALFVSRVRLLGIFAFAAGATAMMMAPRPDILLTGDGKHLAVIGSSGEYALLRERAGGYIRGTLSEMAGVKGDAQLIENWPGARCSPDICILAINKSGRNWRIMATRTRYMISATEMAAACKRVDIVISDRYLPRSCKPRWIKADRAFLSQTGGLAFYLSAGRIVDVQSSRNHMPWARKRARHYRL